MPICKSCGKKYIYLSLGNSNYCENCEPREVIYTDEEFNKFLSLKISITLKSSDETLDCETK